MDGADDEVVVLDEALDGRGSVRFDKILVRREGCAVGRYARLCGNVGAVGAGNVGYPGGIGGGYDVVVAGGEVARQGDADGACVALADTEDVEIVATPQGDDVRGVGVVDVGLAAEVEAVGPRCVGGGSAVVAHGPRNVDRRIGGEFSGVGEADNMEVGTGNVFYGYRICKEVVVTVGIQYMGDLCEAGAVLGIGRTEGSRGVFCGGGTFGTLDIPGVALVGHHDEVAAAGKV